SELELDYFFVERSFLYRPLPENLRRPFLKYALSLAGNASVDLVDSGAGEGKYVFPVFLDRINSELQSPFGMEISEEDNEELPRLFGRWQLTASLDQELAWHAASQEQATP
ncbi:MAG: hypothetical protein ABFR47_03175, partial [Verrucomicrobiota bacterium]